MARNYTVPVPADAGGSRGIPLHQSVAIAAVSVLAPLVALVVANSPLNLTLIVTAGVVLVLVVIWSVEATFYVLIFSMLLSPEFIVGELGGGQLGRGVTLRCDDFIVVVITLAWLVRMAVFKEAGVVRSSPLNAPIFSYIGICALATLVGVLGERVSPLAGFFFVLKYFEYTVIYLLVVNYVRDEHQVRRLLYAALITAVIISVIALLQIPGGGRVTAPFEGENGEPNTLGGYLVLMIAIALAFLSEASTAGQRGGWAVATGLMLVPLVYTYSRTSWLAFCAMLATITVLCRRKNVFIIATAAGLILFILQPPQAIVERATYTVTNMRGSISLLGFTIEPSAAARLQSWLDAASAASQHPLLGWGVTGYRFVDSQYARAIIETGLLGMLAFGWLVARLYQVGQRLRKRAKSTFDAALAIGFLAGFAGVLTHCVGANTFIIVRIMEPFWLLAGLVVVRLAELGEEP